MAARKPKKPKAAAPAGAPASAIVVERRGLVVGTPADFTAAAALAKAASQGGIEATVKVNNMVVAVFKDGKAVFTPLAGAGADSTMPMFPARRMARNDFPPTYRLPKPSMFGISQLVQKAMLGNDPSVFYRSALGMFVFKRH